MLIASRLSAFAIESLALPMSPSRATEGVEPASVTAVVMVAALDKSKSVVLVTAALIKVARLACTALAVTALPLDAKVIRVAIWADAFCAASAPISVAASGS